VDSCRLAASMLEERRKNMYIMASVLINGDMEDEQELDMLLATHIYNHIYVYVRRVL
jgi:hypothetical protein